MIARAVVLATCCASAVPTAAAARQATAPVLGDPQMTVAAGATTIATTGRALAQATDALVPHRVAAERGLLRRGGNVSYRLLKLAAFDLPQEQLLLVLNHEVFGHGARLRERFDGPIGYRIHVPPPYGSGGGSTSFIFDRPPAPHERLAVHAGGVEADGVAAAAIAGHALAHRQWRPRDALRYLLFELDTLGYVLSTDEHDEAGHDVADFLDVYNQMAAEAGAPAMTIARLRRGALVSLANPMLAYAAAGILRYVWSGATDAAVPMLTVGGVQVLPLVRYRLTPYGTEWALVAELDGRGGPMQVEVRKGRAPAAAPWGIGVTHRHLATVHDWRIEGAVLAWRQPRLLAAPTGERAAPVFGGALRGRVERPLVPLWFSSAAATILVDVLVKTSGFVPGEPLDGGAAIRVGIGLPIGG